MSFKICTVCLKVWDSREEFLKYPDLKLIGYQPDFQYPQEGQFLFNHLSPNCGTTLSIPVGEFLDLYTGPIYEELKRELPECTGKCLVISDVTPCPAQCSMAHIRRLMQIIIFSNFSFKNAADRTDLIRKTNLL
jgi:hypothetical protein